MNREERGMRWFWPVITALMTVSLLASDVAATLVLPLNLEQLAQKAERIFHGSVDSVEERFDSEGRWCQFITFSVQEVFKGTAGQKIQIKQINPKPATVEDGRIIRSTLFQGLPQYHPGEELVLFLRGDSAIGFTSPVGLAQGLFRVTVDAAGSKKVVNGANNGNLFRSMEVTPALELQGLSTRQFQALQEAPGALSLEQMRAFLKALTGTPGTEVEE